MITILYNVLAWLVQAMIWALIAAAIFSMLTAFNVIDTRNRFVWSVGEFLYRVTDPILRPIRRLLPRGSAIDISPMIAILLLQLVVSPLLFRVYAAIGGRWQGLVF